MKSKTYNRVVWTLMVGALLGVLALMYQGCNGELDNPATVNGTKEKLDHATNIYEVEFDGQKYIVVDTYRGIGVCKK